MFVKRIDYELNHRIVEPYLSHNFGWMTATNNWNPWINTNTLEVALVSINDEVKRNNIIVKAIHSIEHFLNHYPNDGGCDEGPGYWNVAGGRLIEFINLLSSVSNGNMNWSTNQLIHNMGSYIYKLYIGDGKFVNFADAPANAIVDVAKIMTYGVYFKDDKLKQFASYLDKLYKTEEKREGIGRIVSGGDELGIYLGLESVSLMKNTEPIPPLVPESWLPDLQVLAMRAKEGSTDGLFFAVKGGTNGNSNHQIIINMLHTISYQLY
jgi:hypothetical protein